MFRFIDRWRREERRRRNERFLQSHVFNRQVWQRASGIEDLSYPGSGRDLFEPRPPFIDWEANRTPGGDLL